MNTPFLARNIDLLAFKAHWLWFFVWGIVLAVLGVLAISYSVFTTLASIVFFGALLLLSGGVVIFDAFSFWWRKSSGFLWHLCMGLLYFAAGYILVKNPVVGSMTITFMLGVIYLLIGIVRLIYASSIRSLQWGWRFLNGLLTLLLGILIIAGWPGSSLYIIGLFIGIDLVFCGFSYITMALSARAFDINKIR